MKKPKKLKRSTRPAGYHWRCRCYTVHPFDSKAKYGDTVRCWNCHSYFVALFPKLKPLRKRAGIVSR